MKNDNLMWKITIALIAVGIFGIYIGYNFRQNDIDGLQNYVKNYQSALNEANSNIKEAKFSTWNSYDEMGNALENLKEVEEPTYIDPNGNN